MTLSIAVTPEVEATLREAWGSKLDQVALEALAIEGYRSGKFGSATVRVLLNHDSRWETEQWLADRGIPLNYTMEDLESDRRTLDALFAQGK